MAGEKRFDVTIYVPRTQVQTFRDKDVDFVAAAKRVARSNGVWKVTVEPHVPRQRRSYR